MSGWAIVSVAVAGVLVAAGLLWNAERARQQNERILRDARDAERASLETLRVFIESTRRPQP